MSLMMQLAYRAGANASRSQYQRVVPENWRMFATEWLQGYDDHQRGQS